MKGGKMATLTGEEAARQGLDKESPLARTFWEYLHARYPELRNLGIMGDTRHRAKRSDHNTGMALDLGGPLDILSIVAVECLSKQRFIRYFIFGDSIYHPKGRTDPYMKGDHDDHIHISFKDEYRERKVQPWRRTP
jgi:hypothetical protein